MSKIEAEKLEFESIDFDLHALVEDAVEGLIPTAQAGVELSVFLSADVPNRVNGDPDRFGQVLRNLVGNAVKFTSRGSVVARDASTSRSGGTE